MHEGDDRRLLESGVAVRSRPGEATCGDAAVVNSTPDQALVAAIDGLGHGAEAARAARIAAEIVREFAAETPVSLVRRCHDALKQTRGVAMSLASFSGSERRITWLGIGNVEGRLVSSDSSLPSLSGSLPLLRGVPGHELPPMRPTTHDARHGDVLMFVTDGISAAFADSLDVSGSPQEIANRLAVEHWKGTDDALVVVARYLGEGR
ncbi:MAG: SpoIIE family protein phosphatase [Actinobacteria bacterium]|nr:SpoIIE family protein phosphatase [Actinomycetota bacterium]